METLVTNKHSTNYQLPKNLLWKLKIQHSATQAKLQLDIRTVPRLSNVSGKTRIATNLTLSAWQIPSFSFKIQSQIDMRSSTTWNE